MKARVKKYTSAAKSEYHLSRMKKNTFYSSSLEDRRIPARNIALRLIGEPTSFAKLSRSSDFF